MTASLQPVLQWEAFPGGNKAVDVTYDLTVSKVRSLGYGQYFPSEPVYDDDGVVNITLKSAPPARGHRRSPFR